MGRMGTMAYDYLREQYGDTVLGVDFDAGQVERHILAGRRVVYADPTDPDFWSRIELEDDRVAMALLTMTQHQSNLAAARHLIDVGFPGVIAAIAEFDDQVEEFKELGVEAAFNVYNEAGLGFARHARMVLEERVPEK